MTHAGTQQLTAAFKGPTREQAGRVGRNGLAATLSTDSPGPCQFQPQHGALDKHVRVAVWHRAAGVTARAQQQQQHTRALVRHSSTPAAADAPTTVAAHRLSSVAATDTASATPRSAVDGDASAAAGSSRGQQQQPQAASAAFRAVSRDQRAAAAGGCGAGGPHSSHFRPGYDSLTRPASGGHVLQFAQQTWRAPPGGVTAGDCQLGPGSYFRTGSLPTSLTGGAVAAGHATPSSRPGTAGAAAWHGSGSRPVSARQGSSPGLGLWAWEAAPAGCGCLCGTSSSRQAGEAPVAPAAGSCSASRPASAALRYAQHQRATLLVVSEAGHEGGDAAAAASSWAPLHPPLQQQRPWSVGAQQQRAAACAAALRPASAGGLFLSVARPAVASRPAAAAQEAAGTKQGQHSAGVDAAQTGGATHQSYGLAPRLAPRVGGGSFAQSTGRSPSAAACALATELAYEPRPEVQGHMRRAPGWSLPPNRVATSRQWAQAAARAALQ